MAAVTCDFFSDELEMGTSVSVVLPQVTREQIGVSGDAGDAGAGRDLPVLYLLHGLSDDHSAWTRYTSIERYAAAAGIAVVMPAVGRSFYADEAHGHRYWSYASEELPQVMRSFFRISDRPEDTFVAGLSMGGYGALKLALTHPERYAAAASLSGGLDVATLAGFPHRKALFERVFDGTPGPGDDLFALLAAADVAALPPLHVSCGTDDPLLPMSERMVAEARAAGADVTDDFRPGAHEWGLWDAVVADVIAWLPVRRGTTP
ncbi:esterase family protein [Nocardioides sp. KIGAM211]|uniref:Esterase family protein n=1 Tax=Nocardioides luti TaxID=2761101 RepID=A0A7X0REG7_9ACTN|nr:alpha/beta hydrolase family protein [Nocardioides luti]MBB6626808.1 esterase family protein [Nocardioides luti]